MVKILRIIDSSGDYIDFGKKTLVIGIESNKVDYDKILNKVQQFQYW